MVNQGMILRIRPDFIKSLMRLARGVLYWFEGGGGGGGGGSMPDNDVLVRKYMIMVRIDSIAPTMISPIPRPWYGFTIFVIV
jgi:hypothetical protein